MDRCIQDLVPPIALRDRSHQWWIETKISGQFLDPLFEAFFAALSLPNLMRKSDYHALVRLVPVDQVEAEVIEKLDLIVDLGRRASPVED